MGKITLLFLMIFAFAKTHAQNYQISFAGTGASTTVDSVKVKNLTQCTDTMLGGGDILYLVPYVSINELNIEATKQLNIYPNPTTGNCFINFNNAVDGNVSIGLYDITGRNILHIQELLTKGQHSYQLGGLRSGIYTLKLESAQYLHTAKLISIGITTETAELKHIEANILPEVQNKSSETSNKKGKGKSLISMQYNAGERLKLTGFSGGKYKTVLTQVPTQSQTDTFNFIACTDADSNHYTVVQIDTMIWMAENLKTSKYRNGTPIPNVTGNTQWGSLATGAYCWYNNDSANHENIYGKLYNWYAVNDSNKLCPKGWHVPTHDEWTTLERAICTSGTCAADFPYDNTTLNWRGIDEGGKLKTNCTTLWISPNTGADNESGFTALPGGDRYHVGGSFNYVGNYAYFWSATEGSTDFAWSRTLGYNNADVNRGYSTKTNGLSVHCIKD